MTKKQNKGTDALLYQKEDGTFTNEPLLNDVVPSTRIQKLAYAIYLLRLGVDKQAVKKLIRIME